jgi:hypothetical protein
MGKKIKCTDYSFRLFLRRRLNRWIYAVDEYGKGLPLVKNPMKRAAAFGKKQDSIKKFSRPGFKHRG